MYACVYVYVYVYLIYTRFVDIIVFTNHKSASFAY